MDTGDGCIDMGYVTSVAPNVRQVCITEAANEELYANFICRGYANGCSAADRKKVMFHLERIRKAAAGREIFNTFKVRAPALTERADHSLGA